MSTKTTAHAVTETEVQQLLNQIEALIHPAHINRPIYAYKRLPIEVQLATSDAHSWLVHHRGACERRYHHWLFELQRSLSGLSLYGAVCAGEVERAYNELKTEINNDIPTVRS